MKVQKTQKSVLSTKEKKRKKWLQLSFSGHEKNDPGEEQLIETERAFPKAVVRMY